MTSSVLHVCSNYPHQELYMNLVRALDKLGIRQTIYIPTRSPRELGLNELKTINNGRYVYSHILESYHRVLFRRKISAITHDIIEKVDILNADVVHAHSLFSDGAVALNLFKKFHVPYTVAVRNTDLNYFLKYRLDLKKIYLDILRHAYRVVFINPRYQDKLLRYISSSLGDSFKKKFLVIPNGVSDFWLQNRPLQTGGQGACSRILYVGDFSKNKNIPGVVKASRLLQKHRDVSLSLVGSGGSDESVVDSMLRSRDYSFARRLGRVYSRGQLLSIYREHDLLVVPSFHETFGLVYIEALSQGLPIVYSHGEGVDGYFRGNNVGLACDPRDVEDIKKKMEIILNDLDAFREQCVEEAGKFNWSDIALQYSDIYKSAV